MEDDKGTRPRQVKNEYLFNISLHLLFIYLFSKHVYRKLSEWHNQMHFPPTQGVLPAFISALWKSGSQSDTLRSSEPGRTCFISFLFHLLRGLLQQTHDSCPYSITLRTANKLFIKDCFDWRVSSFIGTVSASQFGDIIEQLCSNLRRQRDIWERFEVYLYTS